MNTIQERALDLFDEHGFDAVTIEQVAAASQVSPSSVYRYFGTKEGLIVADEFDMWSAETLAEKLDPADPVSSLLQAVQRYETPADAATGSGASGGGPWRRVRYFFAEPSVRMAVCATLDRSARRIAPLLASGNDLSPSQARVVANALAFGYFAALESWFDDGGTHPIAEYVEEGLRPFRKIWPTT